MNPAFDVLIDQRYNKYLEANINKNLFEVVRIKLQDDQQLNVIFNFFT